LWFNPGKYSQEDWERNSKHNDWLIREYASFVKLRPNLNSLLVLFEYGSDVNHSKELCKELSLDNQVCWLKMMERREIMELIDNCDIGVGEFYTDQGIIWGGTGWEVMAVGKPLLQGFNFKEAEFEEIYGYLPPPMLPVIVQTDICKHLVDMADNPNRAKIIGQEAREWFNTYNGIGLAKQWLKLLNEDCKK